jgi:hypothetical protein
MALPSTVVYAAGDLDYIAKLNQQITDANLLYAQFLLTQASAFFIGASATSLLIAVASKVFTLSDATARAWTVGMTLHAASNANPANYMEGQITAYVHPTLTVNVSVNGGAGTFADWKIGLASPGSIITGFGPGAATANQFIVVNAAGSAIVGSTLPRGEIEDPCAWMGTA